MLPVARDRKAQCHEPLMNLLLSLEGREPLVTGSGVGLQSDVSEVRLGGLSDTGCASALTC